MTRLVRAELVKLQGLRSTWALLLAPLALAWLALAIFTYRTTHPSVFEVVAVPGTTTWYHDMLGLSGAGEDFALVLGILVVTGEWRHRTVSATFLAEPRRLRVIAAKLVASLLGGALVGAVLALGVMLAALPAAQLAGVGASGVLHAVPVVLPGAVAATALYGLYGAGVGALLRNQVGALVGSLAFVLVGESIFDVLLPSVGRWLPGAAAAAVDHSGGFFGGGGVHLGLLAWWQGALVLVGYGLATAATGLGTAVRADVT